VENVSGNNPAVNRPNEPTVTPAQVATIRAVANERGYSQPELMAVIKAVTGSCMLEGVGGWQGYDRVMARLKRDKQRVPISRANPGPAIHTPESIFAAVKPMFSPSDGELAWLAAVESFVTRARNLADAGGCDLKEFVLQALNGDFPPGFKVELSGWLQANGSFEDER